LVGCSCLDAYILVVPSLGHSAARSTRLCSNRHLAESFYPAFLIRSRRISSVGFLPQVWRESRNACMSGSQSFFLRYF
jgi:hypothetical protein